MDCTRPSAHELGSLWSTTERWTALCWECGQMWRRNGCGEERLVSGRPTLGMMVPRGEMGDGKVGWI